MRLADTLQASMAAPHVCARCFLSIHDECCLLGEPSCACRDARHSLPPDELVSFWVRLPQGRETNAS